MGGFLLIFLLRLGTEFGGRHKEFVVNDSTISALSFLCTCHLILPRELGMGMQFTVCLLLETVPG